MYMHSASALSNASRTIADRRGQTRLTGFEPFVIVLAVISMLPSTIFSDEWWWLRFATAYFAFAISLLSSGVLNGKRLTIFSVAKSVAILDFLPNLLFAIATLGLMAAGIAGYHQYGRPISDLLQHVAALLLMMTFILSFRQRAVDWMLVLLAAIALSSFALGIVKYGLEQFLTYLSGAHVDDKIRGYYELHDICLIMPLFACHYMFLSEKTRSNWIKALLALFISFVGFKRIAIAAALMIIVLWFFLSHKAESDSQRKSNRALQVILIALPVFWVFITSSDTFYQLCLRFGINPMNRNELYAYFSQFVSFNPLQLGMGEGFCVVRLHVIGASGAHYLRGILGVHNDFLRIFVEAGCLGFFAGLLYYVIYFSRYLEKHFGIAAKQLFLICTLYAFVVYCTDNTTYYLVFQCGLYLIISVNVARLSQMSKFREVAS